MVDLTPYRGQSLVLYFNVYNDGNGQRTWQYLDDVCHLHMCYPERDATPVIPTAIPLPTPIPSPIMPTGVIHHGRGFSHQPGCCHLCGDGIPHAWRRLIRFGQMANGEPQVVMVPPGQASGTLLAAVQLQAHATRRSRR